MNIHWEALTAETKELFHLISRLPFISEFYMGGGTGLALQIGHRFSVDLDFFNNSAESDPMPRMISQVKWEQVKKYLDEQAIGIGRKQLELEKLWRTK